MRPIATAQPGIVNNSGSPIAGSRIASTSEKGVRATRVLFFGLCCYLASQAYQIPLAAVGPSWAVWPTLSDVAIAVMFAGLLLATRHGRNSLWTTRRIYKILLYLLLGNLFLLFFLYFVSTVGGLGDKENITFVGVFQVFRLAQFIFVFRAVSSVPLTPQRVKLMSFTADAALMIAFLGLLGTSTSVIPTSLLVSRLPSDWDTAGPWGYLRWVQMRDAGTIGYNHAYTAAQLTMLSCLAMSLSKRPSFLRSSVYMLAMIIAVFLSGSRAGMAAVLFIAVAFYIKKPEALAVSTVVIVLLLIVGAGTVATLDLDLGAMTDRQLSLKNPMEADNLSGRQYIWQNSFAFLQENPVRWIIGAGPGSVAQLGKNAHMLYLHIVMEMGIIGLFIFGYLMHIVISYLRRFERGTKPVLLATIGYLIASLTQETLYPVPAFGHFLGFYFCSIALALKLGRQSQYGQQHIISAEKKSYARLDRPSILQRRS